MRKGLSERPGIRLVVAVARRYWAAGGPNWAAAVGLRLLLAMLPIAVLAGLVIAALLPQTAAPATPARAATHVAVTGGARIARIASTSLSTLLSGVVGDLHRSGGTLGILSVAGLLWIGSGLFACLETATSALFECPGRPYLRQRLVGVLLVLAFAAVVVAGVVSSVLLFPLGSAVKSTGAVGRTAVNARITLQPVIGVLMGVALFTLVFRVLPTCRQRWREVLPGVAIAAAALTLLDLIWPLYLRYAGTTITLSYFLFGFTVALATYVSLLGQVVVVSLAVNATLRARSAQRRIPEIPEADLETTGRVAVPIYEALTTDAQVSARGTRLTS